MSKEMVIKYGQKVTVTIKEAIVVDGVTSVKETVVSGLVSGPFQKDWASIYDENNSKHKHVVIDLR